MLDCSLNKMKLLDFFAELLALANHSVLHTFEKNITAFLLNHESFLASEKFYSHCFIYLSRMHNSSINVLFISMFLAFAII